MANDFYNQMQQRYEGVIRCLCGNTDWKMFIYAGSVEHATAGCKLCGRVSSNGTAWTPEVDPPIEQIMKSAQKAIQR